MVRQINLTETNSQKVEQLAQQTGRTPDEVANEAIKQFTSENEDEQVKFQRWRAALLRLEGMWKDRDDLPDFAELRKSWDRDPWSR